MSNKALALIIILGAVAIAGSSYAAINYESSWPEPDPTPPPPPEDDTIGTGNPYEVFDEVPRIPQGADMATWKRNDYPKYAAFIREQEKQNGIPEDLGARVLYQESRFDPAIIDGRKRSPVGAIGIGQFMPAAATDYGLLGPGFDKRTDPYASIAATMRYLRDLYRMFGDWRSALMAYNWGPGNILKYNRGEKTTLPIETSTYVAQITADVPVA